MQVLKCNFVGNDSCCYCCFVVHQSANFAIERKIFCCVPEWNKAQWYVIIKCIVPTCFLKQLYRNSASDMFAADWRSDNLYTYKVRNTTFKINSRFKYNPYWWYKNSWVLLNYQLIVKVFIILSSCVIMMKFIFLCIFFDNRFSSFTQ